MHSSGFIKLEYACVALDDGINDSSDGCIMDSDELPVCTNPIPVECSDSDNNTLRLRR